MAKIIDYFHNNKILICEDFFPEGTLIVNGEKGVILVDDYEIEHPLQQFGEKRVVWIGLLYGFNESKIGKPLTINNYSK